MCPVAYLVGVRGFFHPSFFRSDFFREFVVVFRYLAVGSDRSCDMRDHLLVDACYGAWFGPKGVLPSQDCAAQVAEVKFVASPLCSTIVS